MSKAMARKPSSRKDEKNRTVMPTAAIGSKGKYIPLTIKIIDTGEVFTLRNVTPMMTVKELKSYLEFATGIPVNLQRIHYLDEGL